MSLIVDDAVQSESNTIGVFRLATVVLCVIQQGSICYNLGMSHLPDQTLRAFLQARLSEEECNRVEQHLLECDECCLRMDHLPHENTLLERLRDVVVDPTARPESPEPISIVTERLAQATSGRYRIDAVLGQGGMGIVYRGHDTIIERDVAIKLVSNRYSRETGVNRYLREARAIGAISHPNVLTIYDVGDSDDGCFLVTELMTGGSLADRIRQTGPLPWKEATTIMVQLCEGLQTAHEAGIIHRDIKPQNVLLSSAGEAKLADFGLALLSTPSANDDDDRSKTVGILGSPHYMSPEQCEGRESDCRTDIYSIGATYYALLTGVQPYQELGGPMQIMYGHCHGEVPDPRKTADELPAQCASIVQRAMAKRPDHRYANVGQLACALQQLSKSEGTSDSDQFQRLVQVPSGPSIAVLPLASRDNDPEQEYFCDGITEEIISSLARFRELRVIAANSTFQYKGQHPDSHLVGKELDADYVLEGSIRRSGERIRVRVELVESATRTVCWNESYDRCLSTADLFDVQDEIAQHVAAAVGHPTGSVFHRHRQAIQSRDTNTLVAYELVLKWYEYMRLIDESLHATLRERFETVTKEGCELSDAWAALAFLYLDELRINHNRRVDPPPLDRALVAARRANEIDPNSTFGNHVMFCIHFHRKEYDAFHESAKRAFQLNPNHSDMLMDYSLCLCCCSDWERGVALTEKAIALSPAMPPRYHTVPALNSLRLGEYEKALSHAIPLSQIEPFWALVILAACYGLLGQIDEGQAAIGLLLQRHPDFPSTWQEEFAVWHMPEEMSQPLFVGMAALGMSFE